jgi:inorganic triphosphatase YgiF
MSDEVELKFDVAAADAEALKGCPALAGAAPAITEADTGYFDTKDGIVRRAGYSLRVRRADGHHVQAVKHKPAAAAGLFVRREWEAEVPGFAVDDAALAKTPLKKLLEVEEAGPLKLQVRSRFRRTIWLVRHKGSEIEVVLDEGKVTAGKAESPLCELELELKSGKPRALFALAGEIGAALPLRLGVLSKAERAYALAERTLGEAATAEPVILPMPVSEGGAFRAVAQSCLRHYRLNEMVLLARRDADALHQARIALRRLRSALSLFRPTVRGKDYQALREEAGWLAGQFGDARNLDVLLAGEEGLQAEEAVRERLLKARAKAYDRVEAALESERVRTLMLNLSLWIEAGAWRFRDRARRDLAGLAAAQLNQQWRRVKRHGDRLGKAATEERHRLRLDVKKLRYSAEFLAALSAKRPKLLRRERFVTALKALQESLGDLNDAEAAQTMAARLAPGLRGNARRLRRKAAAAEAIAEAEEALKMAAEVAGYWE